MKKQYSHLALFFLLCIFAACSDNKNDDIPEPDPCLELWRGQET